MPRVYFLPDEVLVDVAPGETILQASLRSGIPHTHVCGGNARCSTCRVLVVEGLEHCSPCNARERRMADRLHFSPQIRLACQTRVSGDMRLRRLVLDADDVELADQLRTGAASGPVGEEQRLAILFCDIRGFTAFAEELPPYDVIHVLNRHFNRMGAAILRNGGQIDNYMGDGLMALFGLDGKDGAALHAVAAGLEMLDSADRLGAYFKSNYEKNLGIGIGAHYGEVVVGAIGAAGSRRVTAIGDAVNYASRIEAANKIAGTRFLVSERMHDLVRDRVDLKRHPDIALPGRASKCDLFEVIGLKSR